MVECVTVPQPSPGCCCCNPLLHNHLCAAKGGCIFTPLTPPKSATAWPYSLAMLSAGDGCQDPGYSSHCYRAVPKRYTATHTPSSLHTLLLHTFPPPPSTPSPSSSTPSHLHPLSLLPLLTLPPILPARRSRQHSLRDRCQQCSCVPQNSLLHGHPGGGGGHEARCWQELCCAVRD